MLRALTDDLARLPGHRVSVLRDHRLTRLESPVAEHRVHTSAEFRRVWARVLEEVDAVWPIAPETSRVLEVLTERIARAGKRVLSSRADAVRVAASKYATAQCLHAAGLPVVATRLLTKAGSEWRGPVVVKPDDGVGCEGIRLFPNLAAARSWRAPAWATWVVQPWLAGVDASLSLLCGDTGVTLLAVNRQLIERNGDTLVLRGCEPAAMRDTDGTLQRLAERIVGALPGLWGFVGVDVLLTAQGPWVIEVNPRLTSAYVGLSAALRRNVAGAVLAGVAQLEFA